MDQSIYFNFQSRFQSNQFFDLGNPKLMYTLWGFNFILFFFVYKLSERFMNYLPDIKNIKQNDVKINFLLR
jgi:hypothetical protein